MVLIVSDDVQEHLQGPGSISKYGNLLKNSQILTKKSEKDIKWYGMSGTAFRVHFRVYPKKEISSGLTKSEEEQDNYNSTCQGPSNRMLGWWSHDQLPKMVKKPKL